MNINKFEDWKKSVTDLNAEAGKIVSDRDKLYSFIADEIKEAFAKMRIYPENVHVSPSAHEIRVEFKAGDDIIINPTHLLNLHMNFKVGYDYDKRGKFRNVFIFYPFD